MDLQTTFYIMGITFMSLFAILFISMLVLVFYIWRQVSQLQQFIEEKIDDITNRPGEYAVDIGTAVVSSAVKKAKKFFTSEK
ncbi:MAG: hypothetical protein KBD46_03645 [Candidatus Levybacteria bacterium]|nr:hypothetical protein [Candidatus Levybacteria bacterium]